MTYPPPSGWSTPPPPGGTPPQGVHGPTAAPPGAAGHAVPPVPVMGPDGRPVPAPFPGGVPPHGAPAWPGGPRPPRRRTGLVVALVGVLVLVVVAAGLTVRTLQARAAEREADRVAAAYLAEVAAFEQVWDSSGVRAATTIGLREAYDAGLGQETLTPEYRDTLFAACEQVAATEEALGVLQATPAPTLPATEGTSEDLRAAEQVAARLAAGAPAREALLGEAPAVLASARHQCEGLEILVGSAMEAEGIFEERVAPYTVAEGTEGSIDTTDGPRSTICEHETGCYPLTSPERETYGEGQLAYTRTWTDGYVWYYRDYCPDDAHRTVCDLRAGYAESWASSAEELWALYLSEELVGDEPFLPGFAALSDERVAASEADWQAAEDALAAVDMGVEVPDGEDRFVAHYSAILGTWETSLTALADAVLEGG